jgi:chlorite dismutase
VANANTETQPAPELGYTLWAVFQRNYGDQGAGPESNGAVTELAGTVASLTSVGVTLRGFYDVSAFRADADLLIWLHGNSAECLQNAYRQLRRCKLLSPLLPTWNAMGVHREAEFSREHMPAFLRGEKPRRWLTVYPFVRSYDWYILPPEERSAMLAEHGRKGAAFKSVLTNTVAAFGLGDYEWILPLEADELVDLVDVMRALRATEARRHVREEIPFFTGRRIGVEEIPAILS